MFCFAAVVKTVHLLHCPDNNYCSVPLYSTRTSTSTSTSAALKTTTTTTTSTTAETVAPTSNQPI